MFDAGLAWLNKFLSAKPKPWNPPTPYDTQRTIQTAPRAVDAIECPKRANIEEKILMASKSSKVKVSQVSGDDNALGRHNRPHYRAFRYDTLMTLDGKVYHDGQTLLQKMNKQGLEHDPPGTMFQLDEDDFPTDKELAATSTNGTDWQKEVYKLIFYQLHTGTWLDILLMRRETNFP